MDMFSRKVERVEQISQLHSINALSKNSLHKKNKDFSHPQRQVHGNKFCIICGKGKHNTKECFTISKLEKGGWKLSKPHDRTVNFITKDISETQEEEINKSINYLSFKENNPFYKKIRILDKKEHKCLIDTEADCSIINKHNLPTEAKHLIKKSKIKLKSVTCDEIKLRAKSKICQLIWKVINLRIM